jgi:hypothetical protein
VLPLLPSLDHVWVPGVQCEHQKGSEDVARLGRALAGSGEASCGLGSYVDVLVGSLGGGHMALVSAGMDGEGSTYMVGTL